MPDPRGRTKPQPRTAPDTTITVRLPQALKKRMERQAKRVDLSLSEWVRRIIQPWAT